MKINRLLPAVLPFFFFLSLFLVTPTYFGRKQKQEGAKDDEGITSRQDFWKVQSIHRALRPERPITKLFKNHLKSHLPGSNSTKKGKSAESAKAGKPTMSAKDDKASPTNSWHSQKARIIGGEITSEGEYPFFARVDLYHFPLCGGTLIAEDHVLTSAHCYYAENLSVMINQRRIQVEKVLIHPNFNPDKPENDLMLLKLAERVTDIPVIELNFDGTKPENGADLITMGWGRIDDSTYSDVLRDVSVDAIGPAGCSRKYRTVGLKINQDTNICASRIGKDSCEGDSGGPLILKDTGKQVGIVTSGLGCADSRYPGVYTRISAFQKWITDNVPGVAASLAAPGVTSACEDQGSAFRKVSLRSGIDTCAKLRAASDSRRKRVCRRSADARSACKRTCGTCGT